jgi:RNA polymerase sigma factor (sigma-70 family)
MLPHGPGSPSSRRWALTPQAFDLLLAALDPDRERAAVAYEQLRFRLIGLLRWWGATQPEDLADETFDRVARKLESGASIGEHSFAAYVRGVARLVYYEWTREPRNTPDAGAGREPSVPTSADDTEAASDCLERCLAGLQPADRAVLLRYYEGGSSKSKDVRRELAEELGVSTTALRIRAHRLRTQLEKCVTQCLGARRR